MVPHNPTTNTLSVIFDAVLPKKRSWDGTPFFRSPLLLGLVKKSNTTYKMLPNKSPVQNIPPAIYPQIFISPFASIANGTRIGVIAEMQYNTTVITKLIFSIVFFTLSPPTAFLRYVPRGVLFQS